MKLWLRGLLLVTVVMGVSQVVKAAPKNVTLVKDGVSRTAIYVAPEVMQEDKKIVPATTPFAEREAETQRRVLRESVKDLAHYLGKMSETQVDIIEGGPAPKDKRLPIFIGSLARQKLGAVTTKTVSGQGFQVIVRPQAIGLFGESDHATSYAIYEVLDRLGCRWFLPSELGESIPVSKTITLPVMDFNGAPGTLFRHIWYADADFRRRTRSSAGYDDSHYIAAGHALERYVSEEQREQHPEWRAIINGKPDKVRLKWSHPGVQQAVADAIIARLDKQYVPSISLSPEDGASFDESDDTKWDAGDMDPVMNGPSITDRYVKFCNIVAEKVTQKYPDVKLGFLAYVQYTQPPVREKLHPNLVPQFAPINYCRAHAMTDTHGCPSRARLKGMIEGWGKASPAGVSYYNYMFNLAEYSAPYPMIHQMKDELEIIYANNVKYWQPEGMSNFEQVLPGLYLTIRKAWNPQLNSDAVLDEFYTRFYGAAAAPMRKYWELFDRQWVSSDEHSGSGWSYARRFTPEFMQEARAVMNEALRAAGNVSEYRRVEMQNEALQQFERWMQMEWDLNEGRLGKLAAQSEVWAGAQLYLGNKYEPQFAFSKAYWSPNVAGRWFSLFFQSPYLESARIMKNFAVIGKPIREWKYVVDKEKQGEAQGWNEAAFDDAAWKTTDATQERWATLGIPDYFGSMWYRQKVKVPAIPAGKKVFVWVTREDGDVEVWMNGKRAPYIDAKGEAHEKFSNGYGTAVSFDVTDSIKPGAENQITIKGTRVFINELGTGGLLGPVYLYREK